MSEQNELALVLSRIQALSKAKVAAAPDPAPGDEIDDGIPVLTEIYQGQDAFMAVELDHLLAPENSAADSRAGYADTQQPAAREQASPTESNAQAEPVLERLSSDSSIRFLPVDDDSDQSTDDLEPPEREELVAAVLEDIQPVMSDVIRQALIREVQVLGPRLSAELEAALSESVRLRVLGALKNEKPGKD